MFETNNLRIRAVRDADFERLHDLWNELRVQKTLSPSYVVPLGIKFEETLRAWVSDSLFFCIIETKHDSDWIGFVNLFDVDKKNRDATLAVAQHSKFWVKVMPQMFYASSLVMPAIKVYKKIGFVEEGIRRKANWSGGEWEDIIFMAILDEEWAASTEDK
ncbi:acyl-CoA N-acyltransferase [Lentinula aciculospora]|uniref:Acyl-CoA N-acyltransferase n=1 Tax=Lentinula aciculospora TaxID=153920 RepID=A0A9W9DR16_9AGAR|nr:acyl-CoA N-acyltransferase [Lentinula aciculospora]